MTRPHLSTNHFDTARVLTPTLPPTHDYNTYHAVLVVSFSLFGTGPIILHSDPPTHTTSCNAQPRPLRYHVALVISLSIPAHFLERWALSGMAAVMFVCVLLVAVSRVTYNRR
jgi:hypothetical protein